MNTESKRPHYLEHRKRVREKFRKNGLEAFQDYEALELLLMFARPRQDVKGLHFLNPAQRKAVSHTEGPLLIIAGPGSGKTLVLVIRALNILLQGKEDCILSRKIDLLLGEDEKLELLDFKSQPRPEVDDGRLEGYYRQLLIYAHILEQRYDRHPERLYLY